jgi:N6-adenosine-specific RNA methylase IME4
MWCKPFDDGAHYATRHLVEGQEMHGGRELVELSAIERALAVATEPRDFIRIETELEAYETMMRKAGLYSIEQIRPVNELRMRARWRLGGALASVERVQGERTDLTLSGGPTKLPTGFRAFLNTIGLKPDTAVEAQRIGTLPEGELDRAIVEAHRANILCTFDALIDRARPWWYQASRKKRHQTIAANAVSLAIPAGRGPFPLIYADPPWVFNIYSEKGLERTPTQHYPTLTDKEIINFKVDGKRIDKLAHRDAALLLWCTSSNLKRALDIMDGWGFAFKASAVWVKDKWGLGLVFRNKHELLLYGTRGKMPGPQYQPPSVFVFPRGRHSAKPPQVRGEIERMYPDFDERTRLELFAREQVPGWTCHGFEAAAHNAA